MTSSCSHDKLDNTSNVDFSEAEVIRILLLFTSGNEARQKQDVNTPKLFNAEVEDLRTKK
jgi:hypothetical protein